MTESKEMSDRIRKASGRGGEEEPEVVEALAAIREELATVREGVATTLELLQEIHSNTAGEREEPGASEEAAS